jgi:hypothetical protein
MIAKTRLPLTATLVALLACLLCASLTPAALAAKAAPTTTQIAYQPESYAEFEKQLAAGQVQSVTINKRLRSLRITLKDGTHVFAKYAKKTGPTYYKQIEAKGIPLTYMTVTAAKKEQEKSSQHHKIRYIAGAVLIVVLVIAGVILFTRRRRRDEED